MSISNYDVTLFFFLVLESFEEARINLPRAEKGLPILTDPSKCGRGFRDKPTKKHKYPDESTTEESDVTSNSKPSKSRTVSTLQTRSHPSKKAVVQTVAATKTRVPTSPSGLSQSKFSVFVSRCLS